MNWVAYASIAVASASSASLASSVFAGLGKTSPTAPPGQTRSTVSGSPKKTTTVPRSKNVERGSGTVPPGSKECPQWAAPSALAATTSGIGPYLPVANALVSKTKDAKCDVAFYGDSITQLLDMELRDALRPELAKFGVVSVNGIGGDTVEGVTWRACQGLPNARLFVILVGTNNIASTPPDEIGKRVARLAALVRSRRPSSNVLVLGIFWRSAEMAKIEAANSVMRTEALKLDSRTYFANFGKSLGAGDMADGTHPTAEGWKKVLPSILAFYKSSK